MEENLEINKVEENEDLEKVGVNFQDIIKLPNAIKDSLFSDEDTDEDVATILMKLMIMPDEHFSVLAPGILQSFQQELNNPNDRLLLVQSLNGSGAKVEDVIQSFTGIVEEIQELELSEQKKDFLSEIIYSIINMLTETEGIAKREIAIPIQFCHDDAKIPEYAHITDSGMDLFALDDIEVLPGQTVLVPTGIKVALPPGYELQVRPKSGRALKTKLRVANTPGTIDQGYRDEIKVIIENIDSPIRDITYKEVTNSETGEISHLEITSIEYGRPFTIGKGEKFAQLVLAEVPKACFFEVDNVGEIGEDRGGGFGSTGVK